MNDFVYSSIIFMYFYYYNICRNICIIRNSFDLLVLNSYSDEYDVVFTSEVVVQQVVMSFSHAIHRD